MQDQDKDKDSQNGKGNGRGPAARTDKIGAALVVGGGIGGMQAALDLAEAGIYVYLLEREPAIGGTMAQLDKTFPTNDCSMCIMSPKLVETGRHNNIEIITTAELLDLQGEPGRFTAHVLKHPRYVDIDKCTGCGDCAAVCPNALPDVFNAGLSARKVIYKLYPQAIPNAYAIEKAGVAPCRDACPIHQRAQGYVALVREGRFADAYRTILADNPFPSVCGRVCNHRCEDACSRTAAGEEPVNIMALKRFVADWAYENLSPHPPTPSPTRGEGEPDSPRAAFPSPLGGRGTREAQGEGKHIAVVGAGPAGLTCANDLVEAGYRVTVYEALPVPGGMMRVGIPEYRLPYGRVQAEIDAIVSKGIDLRLNTRVDDIAALRGEYDAVFVAVGAHEAVKLPIPGAELAIGATDFLRAVALTSPPSPLSMSWRGGTGTAESGGEISGPESMNDEEEPEARASGSPSPCMERGPGGEVLHTRIPANTTPELWEKLKPLARQMRREPTGAENHLWQRLRSRQVMDQKFRRQHAIDRFIVDFYCAAARLVIEVDGPIHEYTDQEDMIRQEYLESLGLSVLRFTNEEVLTDTNGVVERISKALVASLTSPPRTDAQSLSTRGEGGPEARASGSPSPCMERGPGGEVPNVQNKRVLVLGGGNVAIDAAQTAVRLGAAWVGMSCLESRATMPAHAWEVRDAEEENIEVLPSRTFKEITSENGSVTGVRVAEVDFRGFVDGRPDFDEIPGTEEVIPADVVIFAIGQRPDTGWLAGQVETARGRYPIVNAATLDTSMPGVFAGGDVVTGTAFVVDAIAAGRKAAQSIMVYLEQGVEALATLQVEQETLEKGVALLEIAEVQRRMNANSAMRLPRAEPPKRPAAERVKDFGEMYGGFSREQALAEAARCLACGVCSECNECVLACRAGAIDHTMQPERLALEVGAVILTPGLQTAPGDIRPEYGYGHYANVLTSREFERLLSASGPTLGAVTRPGDGAHPHKVAWIQCVGSRDQTCGADFCSSVCCMYATKEAVIAKEHDARIAPTIFYMDIRAFGKDFERYIERAQREHGVRYVRSMPSAVREVPGTGNLRVQYATPDGKNTEEEFDMVVLSVGLRPGPETQTLARRLGVDLNRFGFAQPDAYHPAETSRPGVYVAGAFAEPKDIPETVIEASCAGMLASGLLAAARDTRTVMPEYPPERDVSEEAPRIGVFVCHCGINIGSVVDVPAVVEYARTLSGVAYAEHNLYTCSQDTQARITQTILEHNLNRVVVASCTPRTHEPLFQDTLRAAGLNPHLFEMANIREQASWVHRSNPGAATAKAKDMVRMAASKAAKLVAIRRSTFSVNHRALVIGGGIAGMTAALGVARQGFPVTLVEREAVLGGNLRHILTPLTPAPSPTRGEGNNDPQQLLQETVAAVSAEPRITVMLETEIEEVGGYKGKFTTTVRRAGGMREAIEHGVVIVATGAQMTEPKAYGYGEIAGVVTQREFEQELVALTPQSPLPEGEGAGVRAVAMIQCVGSRDDEHPYCSRICCTEAIKNALHLKALDPDAQVYILYRDIRTYGFHEELYTEARRRGVIFLQYDPEQPPEVALTPGPSPSGRGETLRVTVNEQPSGAPVTLRVDRVVLSAGISPDVESNDTLAKLLKVPLTEDGFFLEAHVKLRPLDFAAEGIYLAGLAHSPRNIDEAMAQARGAAMRAAALLSKAELESQPLVASVNPRLCAACGVCVEVCPYGARVLDDTAPYAQVVEVLCQGCGACVVACPNKASQQRGFTAAQILDMADMALLQIE
ncbi:MAG: FAD-dependent oxidoreductase [Anaerolineae bacterium]|nr:FAD-dependent oxidoreductase [Anaerolineae bacterium]